jgi:hypothetical protein
MSLLVFDLLFFALLFSSQGVHGKLSKDGKDDDGKDLSFMTMDQYGPWDTTDRAHTFGRT